MPAAARGGDPKAEPKADVREKPAEEEGLWGLSYEGWIAVCTFFLTLATIGLWIFTALLWRATKRAVEDGMTSGATQSIAMNRSIEEAGRAATAMEGVAHSMKVSADTVVESVEINRQIAVAQKALGRAQLRAYVSVLIGGATFQDRSRGLRFATSPLVRNTGPTPARNLRWRIRCGVCPNPIPDDFRFPIPAHRGGSAMLPPGESFNINALMDDMIADDQVIPAMAGMQDLGFFVWGYVIYQDIFRRTHRTTFAQQVIFEASGPMDQDWNYPLPKVAGFYLAKHNRAN